MARKVLGQTMSTATVDVALYTVPADTDTVVSSIVVCNQHASVEALIRIRVKIAGAADNDKQYIVKDSAVAAKTTVGFALGITLAETDVVMVYADSSTVSFNAFGQESAT